MIFGALSLACTKRNRSSVSEFSISLCSSRLKLPRVFSASIPSMSMAWRAAGRSGASSIPSPSLSKPMRISACILREKTRNSKVGGGRGISDMCFYLLLYAVPTPDDERLEVLSEALAQLVRRQRELEERVRALESGGRAERTVEHVVTPPPLPTFDPPPPAPEPV